MPHLTRKGRLVPVAQNKINFAIEGAGKILGVGNGDPSCHEPDTFIPQSSLRIVAVSDWRWKPAELPAEKDAVAEYAPTFDDSSWNILKAKPDNSNWFTLREHQTAIYRAHVQLSEADLQDSTVQIHFSGCDDHGLFFVNGQRVGESHDWQAQPMFDIKRALHVGNNVIAVGRAQRQRPRRVEPERERGSHWPAYRNAVGTQFVQRPRANHCAIHKKCRRNQIDCECGRLAIRNICRHNSTKCRTSVVP